MMVAGVLPLSPLGRAAACFLASDYVPTVLYGSEAPPHPLLLESWFLLIALLFSLPGAALLRQLIERTLKSRDAFSPNCSV